MKNFFIFFLLIFSTSFDLHGKELRILYLGNSISLHENPLNLPVSTGSWGMSATEQSKDYIHRLNFKINHKMQREGRGMVESQIYNVTKTFEHVYLNFDAAKFFSQIYFKPDIVIIQMGENISWADFNDKLYRLALDDLLSRIKKQSDPIIIITSTILWGNPYIDNPKREICLTYTKCRYVNLYAYLQEFEFAKYGHPNNDGMELISEIIFNDLETVFEKNKKN